MLMQTARKRNSPALAADAVHYRVDMANSLIATLALGFAAIFPWIGGILDHLGALFISILMACLGIYAAKQNLNQVIDRVPDQEILSPCPEGFKPKVDGVLGTEKSVSSIRGQMPM